MYIVVFESIRMAPLPPDKPSTSPYWLSPTADGSLTCYHPESREHYHNLAGAYTEAWLNYVQPSRALNILEKTGELLVLDVCFGLGYNTWVLWMKVLEHLARGSGPPKKPWHISVVGIENDRDIIKTIPRVLNDPRLKPLKNLLDPFEHNLYYQTQWFEEEIVINVADQLQISFKLYLDDLRQVVPRFSSESQGVDLVFHDAFSPSKVPQLWTVDLFHHYYRLLEKRQGKLLTYSAAGAVRGGLREAGFHLYRTAGLGRKTGGTLASLVPIGCKGEIDLNYYNIEQLNADEEAHIHSRAGIPNRDETFSAESLTVIKSRQQEQRGSNRPKASRQSL